MLKDLRPYLIVGVLLALAAPVIVPPLAEAQPTTASVTVLSGTREPVLVATTGNIELRGLQSIDGVVPEAGDRVLVRAQTDSKLNGIYQVSESTWRRAGDARDSRSITKGVVVRVQQGSTLANKTYRFDAIQPALGTDAITLTEVTLGGDPILTSAVVNDSDVTGATAELALDDLHDRLSALEATDTARTPVGAVLDYSGLTPPTGWILGYGQCLSQVIYAAYYAVVGNTFTTLYGACAAGEFRAPDLRGVVTAGQDDMGGFSRDLLASAVLNGDTFGANGGFSTHTMTIAQMPLHGHAWRSSVAADVPSGLSGGFQVNNDNIVTQAAHTGAPTDTVGQQIGGTGGGQAHNILQPTIILNKIIYVGV